MLSLGRCCWRMDMVVESWSLDFYRALHVLWLLPLAGCVGIAIRLHLHWWTESMEGMATRWAVLCGDKYESQSKLRKSSAHVTIEHWSRASRIAVLVLVRALFVFFKIHMCLFVVSSGCNTKNKHTKTCREIVCSTYVAFSILCVMNNSTIWSEYVYNATSTLIADV